ncbi:hypothetical protein H5T51_06120, partial [Candidatus Bathyarchaeota archaeon]|nr:hypothetical protein [Candidatus Bathyarchaeota archaeon]
MAALAHICRESSANMTVLSTGVEVRIESIDDLARAYVNILDRERLPPNGLYPKGSKTREALKEVRFNEHKEWIKEDHKRIIKVMRSLATIEWSGPLRDRVIYIGVNPDISAPLLFKINYYSGKRVFLSSRYRDAKLRMDFNSLIFTCVGASLSRAGVLREERIAIYVPVLDPGTIELHKILSDTIQEVRGRLSPDVIFKVLMGLKLRVYGMLPLSLIAVSEGRMRPTLLYYQEVLIDEGISRF